jgi:sterol desaturase/sphingolipid hydroxylase (fatty acid hydroxylase superfamily)
MPTSCTGRYGLPSWWLRSHLKTVAIKFTCRARNFKGHERVLECRWIVPLVWGPILAGILLQCLVARQARTMAMAATFASGILLWQLMEYSIHRFLFHIEPRSQVAITLHFALHGCHHKYPWDKERLVFPPIPAALVAAVVYCVTQALLPKVQ